MNDWDDDPLDDDIFDAADDIANASALDGYSRDAFDDDQADDDDQAY